MKALPTQERALIKRGQLIEAAIEQFSTASFEVATAKSIALAADVATGTFYQYFENKNDILRVIAMQRYRVLQERVQILDLVEVPNSGQTHSSIEQQFLATLEFVYQFHAAEPNLHQVLEHRRALDPKLREIMNQGESAVRDRVLNFVKTFNLSQAEIVADNLYAMAEGLVHRLVFDDHRGEPQKSIQLGAKMLAHFFIEHAENVSHKSKP